jgi:type IV pilus assembly protein PilM
MKFLKNKMAGLLKKDYVLGLDIGASSIKSALFLKQGDGLRLSGLKMVEITPQKQSIAALREVLAGIAVKNCEVITVINSAQAMVKRIVMPLMPYAELREAVSLEVKNYFPFPVIDSLIDLQVIGETVEKGIKKIELLLGVCPRELMREHLHLLALAGVRPSRAIHPSLALYSLLRHKGFQDGLSIAALDAGKGLCDLIIMRDGKLVFSRKIPLCADDFTRAATSVLFSAAGKVQLSYEEAERVKKERGLIPEGRQELIENKITPAQLFSLLRPLGEKLASEIERSFDFYREEAGVNKVDKLILFGGGARLKGLGTFLSESLSLETEIFSSLEWLKVSEGLIDGAVEINRVAIAAGAGLSGTSGINLLPPEIKQERRKAVQRATLKAGVSAAATILLLIFVGMRVQLASINKKIAAAKLELSALQQSFGSPEGWSLMREIIESVPYSEDILKEISNVIPDQICLNEIKMEKRSLIVTGTILSPKNPEEILSRFIHSLERGIFKRVRFAKLENGQAAKEFSLRMEIE